MPILNEKCRPKNKNAKVMINAPSDIKMQRRYLLRPVNANHAHRVNAIKRRGFKYKKNIGQEIHAGLPFPHRAKKILRVSH